MVDRTNNRRATPFYDPSRLLRAIYDTGAHSWPEIATELAVRQPGLKIPTASRVMEWATGKRPLPAWTEREAGRLLMRLWRADRSCRDTWYAEAISPVYAAYLDALTAGVPYERIERLDRLIGTLMADHFGLNHYPGQRGQPPASTTGRAKAMLEEREASR